jgi:GNAT superfamily N-acetyltransferase
VPIQIRSADPDDGPVLRQIERLAGDRYRSIGLAGVADDEPLSLEVLADYATTGRGWVAVDEADHPIGYVVVDVSDGAAHIEQISVRPDSQGIGVGRALINRVAAWAMQTTRPTITLTTFIDVPWNGPLYAHLGFVVLPDATIGPDLRALQAAEAAQGLDPGRRVAMGFDLAGQSRS